MKRQTYAMIRDAILRKIIGATFFFASTSTDLPAALRAIFLRFLALPSLEQARSQDRYALSLFLIWLRPSWQRTIIPLGMCRTCTAESVVFTPCPPGPPERETSIRRSSGLNSRSTSSASGNTATVAVDV